MSTVYTWSFPQFDTKPSDAGKSDVVSVIHWRLKADDGAHSVENYGTVSLGEPGSSFVAFADLTADWAISAVTPLIKLDDIKASMALQLVALANPPIVGKTPPWMPASTLIKPIV